MRFTPRELAERRLELSAEYAQASDQLALILTRRPALWMKLREGVESDKAADRKYEATQDGLEEMRLRMKMKGIEKKLSAAKTMLDVLMGEARNQM